MENPYLLIIIFSLMVIFSYSFTILTRYTKIPSVLLLMGTGVGISFLVNTFDLELPDLYGPLNVLGIVGLMMIVLEGALDLKLKPEKLGMIGTSFLTALITLGITTALISGVLYAFMETSFMSATINAIPLSVVSSAIVIPSVNHLRKRKREYLIYESTFSDILGIMLFDFMIFEPKVGQSYLGAISLNVLVSVLASGILAYLLVIFFQKVKSNLKFFLFLSILALLFGIGKYFHFSALLIILIFGLVLNNHAFFFRGFLASFSKLEAVQFIRKDFRLITTESAFLIRTFFFVVFGMTMELHTLIESDVLIIGGLVTFAIFAVRGLNLKVLTKNNLFPEIMIAPRGLVSILLFYRIPEMHLIPDFKSGILLFIIVGTGLIMMVGLLLSGQKEEDMDRGKAIEAQDVPDGG